MTWRVRFRAYETDDDAEEFGAHGLPEGIAWELYRKLQEKVRVEGGTVEIFEGQESKGKLVCYPGGKARS